MALALEIEIHNALKIKRISASINGIILVLLVVPYSDLWLFRWHTIPHSNKYDNGPLHTWCFDKKTPKLRNRNTKIGV